MRKRIKTHAITRNISGSPEISNDRMLPFSNNVKKKRSCLMCGKMFTSRGSFNRRCTKCSRLVDLGKGGCVNMPHVYKVSPRDSDEILVHNDLIYKKDWIWSHIFRSLGYRWQSQFLLLSGIENLKPPARRSFEKSIITFCNLT